MLRRGRGANPTPNTPIFHLTKKEDFTVLMLYYRCLWKANCLQLTEPPRTNPWVKEWNVCASLSEEKKKKAQAGHGSAQAGHDSLNLLP